MIDMHIRRCSPEHIRRYGEIYAAAFSREPWNNPWKQEDAETYVKEILESRQAYGLEYRIDGRIVGFLLGISVMFHCGRVFEVNDIAVDPDYQCRGIAKDLLDRCISELRGKGFSGIHFIAPEDSVLELLFREYGFAQEKGAVLLSRDL